MIKSRLIFNQSNGRSRLSPRFLMDILCHASPILVQHTDFRFGVSCQIKQFKSFNKRIGFVHGLILVLCTMKLRPRSDNRVVGFVIGPITECWFVLDIVLFSVVCLTNLVPFLVSFLLWTIVRSRKASDGNRNVSFLFRTMRQMVYSVSFSCCHNDSIIVSFKLCLIGPITELVLFF